MYNVLWIWSCPFSIIVSKPCPNGCDVIWSIRQWRNWTSIWESEKRPYIWGLDADLRIGRRSEAGRRSESYIYVMSSCNTFMCLSVINKILNFEILFLCSHVPNSVTVSSPSPSSYAPVRVIKQSRLRATIYLKCLVNCQVKNIGWFSGRGTLITLEKW